MTTPAAEHRKQIEAAASERTKKNLASIARKHRQNDAIAKRERSRQGVVTSKASEKLEAKAERLLSQAYMIRRQGDSYAVQPNEKIVRRLLSRGPWLRRMAELIRDHSDYEMAPAVYENALEVLRYISRRCKGTKTGEIELTLDEIAAFGTGCNPSDTSRAIALLQGRSVKVKRSSRINGKRPCDRKLKGISMESGNAPLTVRNGGAHANRYRVNIEVT